MDELLHYYDRELAYVRRLGAEFGQQHPKIAGRLRMAEDHIEDPHVSRLVESFAFLTARIRHKIDDSLPELSSSLLGTLYPDFQAPIPCMAIVQMLSREEVTTPSDINRGTMLEAPLPDGTPCTFTTCYDTQVLPISVTHAQLMGIPCSAPHFADDDYNAVLKLDLECDISASDAAQLNFEKLRFFLKGQPQHTYQLYEMLFKNCTGIAIANPNDLEQNIFLDSSSIEPVGFDDAEAVIPYTKRSFPGYRLFSEFFALPEKFMFFDIANLPHITKKIGHRFTLYFYFNKSSTYLEQHVDKSNFQLGCTPVINLFNHTCDPIRANDTQFEYQVIPDARRGNQLEVHSVKAVSALNQDGEVTSYQPFFGIQSPELNEESTNFWQSRRQSAEWAGGRPDEGSEVFLSLVSKDYEKSRLGKGWAITVKSLCSNRNLPTKLAFGEGQSVFHLMDGDPNVTKIHAITQPTQTYRPSNEKSAHWQLTKLVNLQQFTAENAKDLLLETIQLLDVTNVTSSQNLLKGIMSVRTENCTRRVRLGNRAAIVYGTEFHVTLDESRFVGFGLYLFCEILNHFFSQYCQINSFTQLVVYKSNNVLFKQWQPQSGLRALV